MGRGVNITRGDKQQQASKMMLLQSESHSMMVGALSAERLDMQTDIEELDSNRCFICGLELEEHALDYNIDLLHYNTMLQECFLN